VPGPELSCLRTRSPLSAFIRVTSAKSASGFALGVAVAFHFIRSSDDPIIRFFYLWQRGQ
jgi:hypothetical protein